MSRQEAEMEDNGSRPTLGKKVHENPISTEKKAVM
jgi:hypothetical protein